MDSCRLLVILPANPSIGKILYEDLSEIPVALYMAVKNK